MLRILQGEAEFEEQFQPLSQSSPALFAKLQRAREQVAGRRP